MNSFMLRVQESCVENLTQLLIVREPGSVHYLPDRSVGLTDKETTKIRAVFDAFCPYDRPCDGL